MCALPISLGVLLGLVALKRRTQTQRFETQFRTQTRRGREGGREGGSRSKLPPKRSQNAASKRSVLKTRSGTQNAKRKTRVLKPLSVWKSQVWDAAPTATPHCGLGVGAPTPTPHCGVGVGAPTPRWGGGGGPHPHPHNVGWGPPHPPHIVGWGWEPPPPPHIVGWGWPNLVWIPFRSTGLANPHRMAIA